MRQTLVGVLMALLLGFSTAALGQEASYVGTQFLTTHLKSATNTLTVVGTTPGWSDTVVDCPAEVLLCAIRVAVSTQIANVTGGCLQWDVLLNGFGLKVRPAAQGCLDSATQAVNVFDTRTMMFWADLAPGTSNVLAVRFKAPPGTFSTVGLRTLSVDVLAP